MSTGDMVGRVLEDRFEIISLIGKGGMASVYRARDTMLERIVAIKVFEVDTSEDRARLGSEVRLLSGLNQPNLVTVHDAHLATAEDDGPSYLVMEFVDGITLREAIATGAVSGDLIVAVASGIGAALHVVHEAGIVHRDVKPANILIEQNAPTATGVRAKLADFGIAHSLGSTRLTATQTVIGTAAYLSPEQAAGKKVTRASDIYSLGLVLLECFTGALEYPGTAAESLVARLGRDPALPSSLPADWSELLRRMLDRDPARRPSALEVAQESLLLPGGAAVAGGGASTMTQPLAKTRLMTTPMAAQPEALTAATTVMPQPDRELVAEPRPRNRSRIIAVLAVAAAIVLLLGLYFFVIRPLSQSTPTPTPSGSTSAPGPSRSTPASTPTPTPSATPPPVHTPGPPPGKGHDKGPGKGPGPGTKP